MRHISVVTAAIAVLSLAACDGAREAYQLEAVSIGNKTAGVPGLATDAKQRLVWMPTVPVRQLKAGTGGGFEVRDRTIICAEPSPDAVSALSAALAASASVGLKNVQVGAEVSKSLSEAVQQLGVRTEGMQLLRDGYYRACEALANGMLDEFGYGLILNQIDNVMLKLVALEAIGHQRLPPADTASKQIIENATTEISKAELARAEANSRREHAFKLGRDVDAATREYNNLVAQKAGLQTEKDKADKDKAEADKGSDEGKKERLQREIRGLEGRLTQTAAAESAAKTHKESLEKARNDAMNQATEAETKAREQEQKAIVLKAQAQTVKGALPPESTAAVLKVLDSGDRLSTITGACMMWLARNPEVQAAAITGNEPAFVTNCRDILNLRREITKAAAEREFGKTLDILPASGRQAAGVR